MTFHFSCIFSQFTTSCNQLALTSCLSAACKSASILRDAAGQVIVAHILPKIVL